MEEFGIVRDPLLQFEAASTEKLNQLVLPYAGMCTFRSSAEEVIDVYLLLHGPNGLGQRSSLVETELFQSAKCEVRRA